MIIPGKHRFPMVGKGSGEFVGPSDSADEASMMGQADDNGLGILLWMCHRKNVLPSYLKSREMDLFTRVPGLTGAERTNRTSAVSPATVVQLQPQ